VDRYQSATTLVDPFAASKQMLKNVRLLWGGCSMRSFWFGLFAVAGRWKLRSEPSAGIYAGADGVGISPNRFGGVRGAIGVRGTDALGRALGPGLGGVCP